MYSIYQKIQAANVDIYSDDFFSTDAAALSSTIEDPCNSGKPTLELRPIEEELSHSNTRALTETPPIGNTASSIYYATKNVQPHPEPEENNDSNISFKNNVNMTPMDVQKSDEYSGTNTTCKSTVYGSSDVNDSGECSESDAHESKGKQLQPLSPKLRLEEESHSYKAPLIRNAKCSSMACLAREEKLQHHQKQIRMLKSKIQKYKERLKLHNLDQGLSTSSEGVEPRTSLGTALTTHKEKTYADMMGPWDIPFHIELTNDNDSDEESEITFALHPCKMGESSQGYRKAFSDDDGALPVSVIQRIDKKEAGNYTGRHSKTSSPSQNPNKKPRNIVKDNKSPKRPKSGARKDRHHQPSTLQIPENRVHCMRVVLERKYCLQKAWYSGPVHPESGCPHGMGTLHFDESGDRYIGEVKYGEMHGRGTYYFCKKQKIFRGNFVHNTFIGDGEN